MRNSLGMGMLWKHNYNLGWRSEKIGPIISPKGCRFSLLRYSSSRIRRKSILKTLPKRYPKRKKHLEMFSKCLKFHVRPTPQSGVFDRPRTCDLKVPRGYSSQFQFFFIPGPLSHKIEIIVDNACFPFVLPDIAKGTMVIKIVFCSLFSWSGSINQWIHHF